jgi:hypothetical protein
MNKVRTVHVKNPSFSARQFFAPLNRWLKPRETIDVVKLCEGDCEIAYKIAENYMHNPVFEVFVVHETLSTPEGLMQEAAQGAAFESSLHALPTAASLSKKAKRRAQREQALALQAEPVSIQDLGSDSVGSAPSESDEPL